MAFFRFQYYVLRNKTPGAKTIQGINSVISSLQNYSKQFWLELILSYWHPIQDDTAQNKAKMQQKLVRELLQGFWTEEPSSRPQPQYGI